MTFRSKSLEANFFQAIKRTFEFQFPALVDSKSCSVKILKCGSHSYDRIFIHCFVMFDQSWTAIFSVKGAVINYDGEGVEA